MRSNTPLSRQAYKSIRFVVNGGKHLGIVRHGHPDASMYWIASNTSRKPVARGRSFRESSGSGGVITSHSILAVNLWRYAGAVRVWCLYARSFDVCDRVRSGVRMSSPAMETAGLVCPDRSR